MGMGGVRTAGDLVLRMQLAKSLKIDQAKEYVARRLEVNVDELSDCSVLQEVRQLLDIGYSMPAPGAAKGLAAKVNIARVLGLKINAVERFKEKTGLK